MPVFGRSTPAPAPTPEAGEMASFAQLYATFFDSIYWYCRSRLGDAVAAEDAASTVFTRALAAGPRYDDPSLRSWLFGIAHNVIANTWRAARPTAPLEAVAAMPAPEPPLEEAILAGEDHARLLGALSQLPPDQRQVVACRLAGLTGPEIAQLVGRSHGAVKMLQLRAFAALRDELAAGRGEEGLTRHG
jgi:RNA polymerase sigma factor (sigma-70 family)